MVGRKLSGFTERGTSGTGLGTRDIAERLHVDIKTVETYRSRLKEKLKLKDGNELLQLAIRWNHDRAQSGEMPR